jgi:hypothetical protein
MLTASLGLFPFSFLEFEPATSVWLLPLLDAEPDEYV